LLIRQQQFDRMSLFWFMKNVSVASGDMRRDRELQIKEVRKGCENQRRTLRYAG
jgi:hypothetical protein